MVEDLGRHRAREHEVAPGFADDLVAVASDDTCMALRVRRADRDVEPRLGPVPGDGGGVHLGSARFDVVEIAPGQEMDAAEARGGGQVADLHGARVAVAATVARS